MVDLIEALRNWINEILNRNPNTNFQAVLEDGTFQVVPVFEPGTLSLLLGPVVLVVVILILKKLTEDE